MRGLSDNFMEALKSGLLQPVLERVKKDDTLMMGIRKGYINIYYRGGNILKITEKGSSYNMFFDKKYDLSQDNVNFMNLLLPESVTDSLHVNKWISSLAFLKEYMDLWFNKNPKKERESQQLVVKENNRSTVSGETEYFITDIEFADTSIGARFDMLAIKWPDSLRKDNKGCKATFIEMKYGDEALKGNAGLIKHIRDINNFLDPSKDNYSNILETMSTQFNQLDKLELINFNHSSDPVLLNAKDNPEFVFLIAKHNPNNSKLKSILCSSEFKELIKPELYDLRFYVSSDAGYGMHISNMVTHENYVSNL